MTRSEIIKILKNLLTVNQTEVQAINEAIAILTATEWCDPENGLPKTDDFVLGLLTGTMNGIRCERTPYIINWINDGCGWMLVNTPDAPGDDWVVDKWMEIPE